MKRWLLPLAVLFLATPAASAPKRAKAEAPKLKIVKDDLLEQGNFYVVKGTVHNPSNRAVKNVTINYYVWGKFKGQKDYGLVIYETGGLLTTKIKYVPPKGSVDFVAESSSPYGVPVMTEESGLKPDPIEAEIHAEWDD